MKVGKESVHKDFGRNAYWSRLYLISDDGLLKSIVLICVSDKYLRSIVNIIKIEESVVEQCFKKIIDRWISIGDDILKKEIYYDVYATLQEGKYNGLKFLQEEIAP